MPLQTWEAEADEEKYWYHIDVIKSWPEDVQKKFMYNAYQVKPDTYSGASGASLRRHSARRRVRLPARAASPCPLAAAAAATPLAALQACPRACRRTTAST